MYKVRFHPGVFLKFDMFSFIYELKLIKLWNHSDSDSHSQWCQEETHVKVETYPTGMIFSETIFITKKSSLPNIGQIRGIHSKVSFGEQIIADVRIFMCKFVPPSC